MAKSYKELNIWKRSYELVFVVYQQTKKFPKEERYALVDQINRAVVSVSSNIAEGFGRGSNQELVRYCNISKGSLFEIETQIMIAERLGYIPETVKNDIIQEIEEISRMITSFQKTLTPKSTNT